MAAKLSAVAVRAVPRASASPSEGVAATVPPGDSSDAVQLEPYVVREDRVPDFKERDILTPKGKLALARRRYPGLGPRNDAVALMMLEEDFARERRREMTDLPGLLDIGRARPSPDVKRKMDEAAVRPGGLSTEFGAPFRPPK